jgi:hypothetical protein
MMLLFWLLTAAVLAYACGSTTVFSARTSLVTISIGRDSGQALLKIERATLWNKARYVLADASILPEAQAYIPSVVQTIVVTVSAPDMTTIVAVDDVSDKTATSLRIEVPNGRMRQFLVEGIHAATNAVTYRASTETDVDGTEVSLPITMQFNFFGPAIFVDSARGSDLNSGLTYTSPLQSITRALSLQSTTVPYTDIPVIWVEQGDYPSIGAAATERFPLQLNPGTALVCGGRGFTSVIDASGTNGLDLIYGNAGASIDNCKLLPGSDTTAIDDRIGGPQGTPAPMKVNGVLIDASPQVIGGALDGIMLSADSVVLETTVLNTTWHGINVLSGRPVIRNCRIEQNPTGIEMASDALVTESTISGNTDSGINILSAGTPTIMNNVITNNTTGIAIGNGAPLIRTNVIRSNFMGVSVTGGSAAIGDNSIDHNNAHGIYIATSTGDAKINDNSIFCNSVYDVYIPSAFTAIDLQNNAWDHDSTTVPPGPLSSNTGSGLSSYDIVYSSSTPTPLFSSILPAVPGGCVPIPAQ